MENERSKLSLRIKPEMKKVVDRLTQSLGVTQQTFFVMAILQYAVTLSPLLATKSSRRVFLTKIETEFEQALRTAWSACD